MLDLAVIVLNWNNWQLTIQCVNSIKRNRISNIKIIVVDNGSTDDSFSQLKLVSGVDLVGNKRNYGFAEGNNLAVEYAISCYNPKYFLLLNNDAELKEDALIKLYYNREKAGILSPKIYYEDRKTLWACGGKIDLWRSLAWNDREGKIDKNQYENIRRIKFASGCALWISREVIETIGLFDEKYFCYYEDVDLSMRAINKGISILFIPEAVVYHKSGATSGGNTKAKYRSSFSDLLSLRNRILFANKYIRNRLCSVYFSLLISVILRIIRKQNRRAYMILRLMWIGLKGNNRIVDNYPVQKIQYFKD